MRLRFTERSTEDEVLEILWEVNGKQLTVCKRDLIPLLKRRSVLIRLEVVRALSRIGPGTAHALRSRALVERNEVVLSEIIEALEYFEDRASIEMLKNLASRHSSQLVRSYASVAAGEVLGHEAVPYLLEVMRSDNSPRVRASVAAYLAGKDYSEALGAVGRALQYKDVIARRRVANRLGSSAPEINRAKIISLLTNSLKYEPTPGGQEDLEDAIRALKALPGRRVGGRP